MVFQLHPLASLPSYFTIFLLFLLLCQQAEYERGLAKRVPVSYCANATLNALFGYYEEMAASAPDQNRLEDRASRSDDRIGA